MSETGTAPQTASILVLPGGLAESLAFRESAIDRGMPLVGASSLRNDPAAAQYDNWCYLPTVHEPGFEADFQSVLERYRVKTVFCPHPILHARLGELRRRRGSGFDLLNPPPQAVQERKVASDLRRAAELAPFIHAQSYAGRRLDQLEIAALLRSCAGITGQSDETKLAAIMAIFPELPSGDVVEIGGFWGRSAFALAWLAARFENGPVLVIDPWHAEEALQNSVSELVRRDTRAQDWERIHQGFLLNLLPVARGRLGFLRMTSSDAHRRYTQGPSLVESPPFGSLTYGGDIALLQIDGNHDEAAVALDVALWVKHIRPRGWLVLDDYVWSHGDGPARTGDALLRALGDEAAISFVAGKALFIRMA